MELYLARDPKAGALNLEFSIGMARMATELVSFCLRILDQCCERRSEDIGGECSCCGYAKGAGSSSNQSWGVADEVIEARSESLKDSKLELAEERGPCVSRGPPRLERPANFANTAALCGRKDGTSDGREEVSVFMGVDMSDVDSGALELAYLSLGFAGQMVGVNTISRGCLGEVEEGSAEIDPIRAEQSGDEMGR